MEYIGVITHLLTIDPNFQRDIIVGVFFVWGNLKIGTFKFFPEPEMVVVCREPICPSLCIDVVWYLRLYVYDT